MSTALTYRLTAATIALFSAKGGHVARAIPQGSIIRVDHLNADKLIEVVWQGQTVLMFAEDLKERGERVLRTQPSSSAA